MKTNTITILFLFLVLTIDAQIYPDKYFVRFTDKNNSPYSVENPSEFLSQRAIERRQKQGISIEESDLPVNPAYIQGVANVGAVIINPSKWLNGVSVYTNDPTVISAINALPYVSGVTLSPETARAQEENLPRFEKPFFAHEWFNGAEAKPVKSGNETSAFNYGMSLNQIQMMNGDSFHQMGFRGQGMVIAVLDAGYLNTNTMDVFDSLWQNNRILGTRDFVLGGEVQFDDHWHGTMVLSCMGGNYPGELIGTAPLASYWLLRSEDAGSEYLIEEYNWVSAAEFADSVGADVINSSLGYGDGFTDSSMDHTYSEMDGNTTAITIGADMAARKGILVVNSLGNEGNSDWYYLSAPSDGDSVLGIGAVDPEGNYAPFSSHGPSYDGRAKPDVVAQGSNVWVANPGSGTFGYSAGTSFSSPILAGMAACLWQANPSMNNMQVAQAIRESASKYTSPDEMLGYGIPDFLLANDLLTVIDSPDGKSGTVRLFPNPFKSSVTLRIEGEVAQNSGNKTGTVEISDYTGRVIGIQMISVSEGKNIKVDFLEQAPKGIYFVKVNLGDFKSVEKIIKY